MFTVEQKLIINKNVRKTVNMFNLVEEMKNGNMRIIERRSGVSVLIQNSVTKEKMPAITQTLKESLNGTGLRVSYFSMAVDITLSMKSEALSELSARLNIPFESFLVFGDGTNDIEMLTLPKVTAVFASNRGIFPDVSDNKTTIFVDGGKGVRTLLRQLNNASRSVINKKVLLIHPEVPGIEPSTYRIALGLPYLAGELRTQFAGIEVRILDMHMEKKINPGFDFCEFIRKSCFDVVGVYMVTAALNNSMTIASQIKTYSPDTVLVAGGPHPTSRGEDTLKESKFDISIIGEGEKTFSEVVAHSKTPEKWDLIKGIYYKTAVGNIIKTTIREPIQELDLIPFPAMDLISLDSYPPMT